MRGFFWPYLFVLLSLFHPMRVNSKCSVSDLKHVCSSSQSVMFEWSLTYRWTKLCGYYTYRIKAVQNDTNISTIENVPLTDKIVIIKKLDKDKFYKFKFVQYYKEEYGSGQVNGSYKAIDALTHEAGKVESLNVSYVLPTQASISWASSTTDSNCVSHYVVELCWSHSNENKCKKPEEVNTPRKILLKNLEPCTEYEVTVTAVDRDKVASSQNASKTFSTHFQAPGLVTNATITKVTADSLTVKWDDPMLGAHCVSYYHVSISHGKHWDLHPQKVEVKGNYNTFTFTGLDQCSYYNIQVKPISVNGNDLEREHNNWSPQIGSFTSMSSNATVSGIKVYHASENELGLFWQSPKIICIKGYKLQIASGKSRSRREETYSDVVTQNHFYFFSNLQPCTTYNILLSVVFWGDILSQESVEFQATTSSTGFSLSEPVQNVRIEDKSTNSLNISWEAPVYGYNCVKGYTVYLKDSVVDSALQEMTIEQQQFKFTNLRQCEFYRVYVIPVYETNIQKRSVLKETFIETFTTTKDDVAVDLSMSTTWKTLELDWRVPANYTTCIKEYKVEVCYKKSCYAVEVNNTRYFEKGLVPCVEYKATVTTKLSQTTFSTTSKSLTKLTSGKNAMTLNDFKAVNETSNSVSFQWKLADIFENCQRHFVIISVDMDGTMLKHEKLHHSVRNCTIIGLKQCHSYSFTLVLEGYVVDPGNHNYQAIVKYKKVNTATRASDSLTVSGLKIINFASQSLTINWFLSKEFSGCVSHFMIKIYSGKNLSTIVNTTEHFITWNGNVCSLDNVSVEIVSNHELVGKPAYLNISKMFEDVSLLSLMVRNVRHMEEEVCLVRSGFVCNTHYNITWLNATGHALRSTPVTPSKNCLPAQQLSPCTTYTAIVQPWNGLSKMKTFNHTVFTPFEALKQMKNVTVTTISNSEAEIKWQPLDDQNESPSSYIITLTDEVLKYKLAPFCSTPKLDPVKQIVNGNINEVIIKNLQSDMEFKVSVVATTTAGSHGPYGISCPAKTMPGVSEPVTNLTVNVSQNITTFSWQPPCISGGTLSKFQVTLNGTRYGDEIVCHSWPLLLDEDLNYSYVIDYKTSDLMAEATYDVTVTPIGINGIHGENATQYFTTPPRIPTNLGPIEGLLFTIQASSSSATVTFSSKLFSNDAGTIKYYAIMVAEEFRDKPESGWLKNGSWPITKTWASAIMKKPIPPYQATPPWWQPKDSELSSVVKFEVGTSECSKKDFDAYCNGPLEPGTKYFLRIRAFTSAGFTETNDIPFETENTLSAYSMTFLLLVVMAIVTVAAFVYLVIKSNIKWVEDKKVIEREKRTIEEQNHDKLRKGLTIQSFLLHAETILSSSTFLKEEYEQLEKFSKLISDPQTVGRLAHNKKKNRYTNIVPYDSNRVILEGGEDHDYINASHIKLQEADSTHYIACQAPKESECERFWRMIIQYKVNIIVMLCMPVENAREKCFIYYPTLRQVLMFEDISIYCANEEQFQDYVIRHLVVDKGGNRAEVRQLHFTNWPDFDVPKSPEIMVEFIRAVRQQINQKESVIAVHCSAGVGRTGTFIAIDALLRKIRQPWNCRFNVFDIIIRLRKQRCRMVQTQKQYEYIYKCIKYKLKNNPSFSSKVGHYLSKTTCGGQKQVKSESREVLHWKESSDGIIIQQQLQELDNHHFKEMSEYRSTHEVVEQFQIQQVVEMSEQKITQEKVEEIEIQKVGEESETQRTKVEVEQVEVEM